MMNGHLHPDSANRGSVLLYLIAVMTIVGVLAAGMLKLSMTSRETLFSANSMNQAQFLAESGLRIAQSRYCAEGELATPLTITLLSGEEVLIEKNGAETHFNAIATAFPGTPLEARAEAIGIIPDCSESEPVIPPDSPDDYVLYSGGGTLDLPSHSNILSSVFGKSVITESGVDIAGNVVSETSITIESASNIGGFVCAANGYVILKAASTVVAGNVYAPLGNVIIEDKTIIHGSIFTKGTVILKSAGIEITGDIHAGKTITLQPGSVVRGSVFSRGKVLLTGSSVTVEGDIHAGEDFSATGSSVHGNVYAQGDITLNGSRILGDAHANGNIILTAWRAQSPIIRNSFAGGRRNDHSNLIYQNVIDPIEPDSDFGCPSTPPPKKQTITPDLTKNIVFSQFTPISASTIAPGVYGRLQFGGGATVTLQAGTCSQPEQTGCYVFQSFGPASWGQTLRLDLSTDGYITVLVKEDIEFSGPIFVKTKEFDYTRIENIPDETARELARRVYWETHGKFTVASSNGTRRWFGTVLSEGRIHLEGGIIGIGAFASINGGINVSGGTSTVSYVLADFAKLHWFPQRY